MTETISFPSRICEYCGEAHPPNKARMWVSDADEFRQGVMAGAAPNLERRQAYTFGLVNVVCRVCEAEATFCIIKALKAGLSIAVRKCGLPR